MEERARGWLALKEGRRDIEPVVDDAGRQRVPRELAESGEPIERRVPASTSHMITLKLSRRMIPQRRRHSENTND